VSFSASEPDSACRFAFDPPRIEVAPGQTAQSRMTVRPPGQIWLGRPLERRLEVQTQTGDAVTEAPAPEPAKEEDGNGLFDQLGEQLGAKAPKVGAPSLRVGPQGVDVRQPQLRAPRMRVPSRNLRLDQLKMPSRGQATPAPAGPLLPTQAVFRQKAWLPWWLAVVVPLLAALAAFFFLLLPKNVTVPAVVGKPSAFAAGEALTEAGLKLAPQVDKQVDPKSKPGTVLKQTPSAGDSAKKDSEVSILVAVGDGKVTVPDLKDKTAGDADKVLRGTGLSLGQATPQPLDTKARIATQIPAAKEIVARGAPVNIFLAQPAAAKADGGKGKDDGKGKDAGKDAAGKAAAVVAVPPVAGLTAAAAAQKLGDAGVNPKIVKQFNDAKKGTILKVVPDAGQKAKKGARVTLFVSAGIPEVAFDDAQNVLIGDGTTGKTIATVSKGSQVEENPTFSADGGSIAFTSDGQVFLRDLGKKAAPIPLTAKGERFTELAWAPTVGANVVAMVKRAGDTLATAKTSLCFARVSGGGAKTRCKPPSPNVLGRKINWAGKNGKTLLVWGASPEGNQFGVIRYRSAKPFSTDPGDWKSDGFVTDTTRPGQGALDAVPSPDGKQLAVVRLGKDGVPLLFLAKPGDFLLSDPRPLGVVACKATWRPDGKELLVVRADNCFNSVTGNLVRVPVDKPRQQRSVRLEGDNPSFQPLNVE